MQTEFTYLGHSGLRVSRLCLGTMMFGGSTDRSTAGRIIASVRDHGVNFFDTAYAYNAGDSEAIIGSAIARDRDTWVLATKLGNPMGAGPNGRGQSRRWIISAAEASLRRLDTDYFDILYLHRSFEYFTLPEAVRAVGELIRQGKVRYLGVSNHIAWRLGAVCHLADRSGMDPPAATQPVYSIVDRTAEREQILAASHYGVGVVTYSPLARCVVSGKYALGSDSHPLSRAGRGDERLLQTEWRSECLAVAERLTAHATRKNLAPTAFAIGWVFANRGVSSVIGGPRTFDQWTDYLAASQAVLDSEDEAFVDALVSPGHASTPGYIDPAYPVEGRKI